MKKTYRLKDLDCANCAAKMENRIGKINGVTSASISFMTQKLTLEAQDDRFDDILSEVKKAVKKVDSAVELVGYSFPRRGCVRRPFPGNKESLR